MRKISGWLIFGFAAPVAVAAWAAAPKAAPKPAARPAAPAPQQVAPPKARYAMDVSTVTGMGGMAGGGMGAAMSMMFGGKPKEMRMLNLRLGSSLEATGKPQADHFFLPAAKLGKSVPLLTPQRAEPDEEMPRDFQRPKGRLLVFWGCGANAPKGQPVIIDFAKVAAGQMPPGLFTSRVPRDRGPNASNSRIYAEWPNAKSGKQPQGGSLVGEHRVVSTYAPEIKYSLVNDYMPGLNARAGGGLPGTVMLSWNAIAPATGYYAWIMGAKMGPGGEPRDMVWWSSSQSRDFGGGLWDWLSPETVRRLIADKTVMPPSQTSCTVPAEVKAAAGDFMMANIYAYGPEENFAYPPRPATGPWNPDWTARVRFRSHTSLMIGGPMGGM